MRSKFPVTDPLAPSEGRPVVIHYTDYRDDGVYRTTWPDGHTTTTVLQNPKFSVLMEFSIEAYCDQYYREALLSCASSLDSYLDYHIEILVRAKGCDHENALAMMKLAAKQAERRLGMFFAVEVSIRGCRPEYISQRMIELRNDVVHKGYIPEQKQVLCYLQGVVDFITPRYRALHDQHRKTISELFFKRMNSLPPPETPTLSHVTHWWAAAIEQLTFKSPGHATSLNDYIAALTAKKQGR